MTVEQQLLIDLSDDVDRIAKRFKPFMKITLVIRNPGSGDGDVLLGDDDPDLVVECIRKMQGRAAVEPPPAQAKGTRWRGSELVMNGSTIVGTVTELARDRWLAHGCATDWQDVNLREHGTQDAAKQAVEAWVDNYRREKLVTARCHFCQRPVAGGPCVWTVNEPRLTILTELEIGEQVQWVANGKRYKLAAVVQFEAFYSSAGSRLFGSWPNQYFVGLLRENECYVRYRSNYQGLFAIRPDQCRRLSCDLHHREIAPGRVWCMDHWNSWEIAA